MMGVVADWLSYSLPWWLLSVPAAVGVVAVFIAVSRVAGFRNALVAALAVAAAALASVGRARGRQEGWKKRVAEEKRDAENIVRRAREARNRADAMPVDRLRDDDGFRRD